MDTDGSSPSPITLSIYALQADFDISLVTWANQPPIVGEPSLEISIQTSSTHTEADSGRRGPHIFTYIDLHETSDLGVVYGLLAKVTAGVSGTQRAKAILAIHMVLLSDSSRRIDN